MHLYVVARGVKTHQDNWVTDLLAKYLPYEYEKGKQGLVQLSVRPVQMYEIVFPESQLDEVLKAVKPGKVAGYPWLDNISKMFSKLLKLKKIPEFTDDGKFRMAPHAVTVHGIGIKDDIFVDGIEHL